MLNSVQFVAPSGEVPPGDHPTIELIVRARGGDSDALGAIFQRCLPAVKRWAHGRLPAAARGHLDTGDLVQETALHLLDRLATFEPRHAGSMQAYLRQSVINRIRDEVRRIGRRPAPVELPEDLRCNRASPLETATKAEERASYRAALMQLRPKDRRLIVARVELQWTLAEIAEHFGMASVDAARVAVSRAMQRLAASAKRRLGCKPSQRARSTNKPQLVDVRLKADAARHQLPAVIELPNSEL
jgi:RNA polymerase sigma-70 factor (ECF subfamily)